MIAPGVERVDTVKPIAAMRMKSIWSRNDLSDTSILKLSTATGYIYGYVQNLESGMCSTSFWTLRPARPFSRWMFPINTVTTTWLSVCMPETAATLYRPTGYLELLRLQDRFVYLPEMPYRKVDLDKAARNVLTQAQFEQDGGEGTVASWRNTANSRKRPL